jgi:hypothetical protein
MRGGAFEYKRDEPVTLARDIREDVRALVSRFTEDFLEANQPR